MRNDMVLTGLLNNVILVAALIAWASAQIVKLPIEYLRTHSWKWGLLLSTGGMPSSHSALIVGVATSIGLHLGFDSALFALALAIAMIVTYDAAGVRRQAGMHAERINTLFDELLKGHIWDENELREVLGHTPLEVTGGMLWGILITTLVWWIWK
jgi:uncharacterized protein